MDISQQADGEKRVEMLLINPLQRRGFASEISIFPSAEYPHFSLSLRALSRLSLHQRTPTDWILHTDVCYADFSDLRCTCLNVRFGELFERVVFRRCVGVDTVSPSPRCLQFSFVAVAFTCK
jgi:hypothetical protein